MPFALCYFALLINGRCQSFFQIFTSLNTTTMRTLLFVSFIALTLVVSACFEQNQPKTTNSAPPSQESVGDYPHPEQQGKAFSISTEAFYQATLPSTSSPGRIISLRLTPDGNALMTTDYLDQSRSIADKGEWTTLDNGNLLLNLVRVDGKDSTKLEFKTEGEKLIYTGTDFGTPGFALWVKPIPNAEAK